MNFSVLSGRPPDLFATPQLQKFDARRKSLWPVIWQRSPTLLLIGIKNSEQNIQESFDKHLESIR